MTTVEHALRRLPYVEVHEEPDRLFISADVVPMEKHHIAFTHTEKTATLASEKHKFEYTFDLPAEVKLGGLSGYNNGVLTAELFKAIPNMRSEIHVIRMVTK